MNKRLRGLYFMPDGDEAGGGGSGQDQEEAKDKRAKDAREESQEEAKGGTEKRKPQYGEPGYFDRDRLERDVNFYARADQEEARKLFVERLAAKTGDEPRARQLERKLLVKDIREEFELEKADELFLTADDEDGIRAQAKALKARLSKAATTKKKPSDDDLDEGDDEDEETEGEDEPKPELRDRSRKAPTGKDAIARELRKIKRSSGRG